MEATMEKEKMEMVTRTFKTFHEILEVIQAIKKKNVRIYLEQEVIEAANEAATKEINVGTLKTPIFIAQYTVFQEESLLMSFITPKGEITYDFESKPVGEYHLGLELTVPYGEPY